MKEIMDVVIKVENLTKEYRLGTISHGTLSQDLQSWWARIRGKEDPNSIISHQPSTLSGDNPHFLALNDVSFEVKRGEILGIIGRNGAGKSTLLKILSKVTAPTSGAVKIKGRVASLLEVGTGFHPELTGRENVYLNGAILGMSKREIDKKFDEIVAFAEIDKFIDTPVKRYSSGMYVRLAFAVAAHLEPEILIIDEVLAVGDAQFQKKCLGKMGDVAKGGRTVLFVSHNMAAISRLCPKVLLLNNGKVDFLGDVNDGVDRYQKVANVQKGFADFECQILNRQGPKEVSKLLGITTMNENYEVRGVFKMGSKVIVKIEFEIVRLIDNLELTFYFLGFENAIYGVYSSVIEGYRGFKMGRQSVMVEIPSLNLLPGNQSIGVWIAKLGMSQDDLISPALEIEIISDDLFTGHHVDYMRYKHYGVLSRSLWKSV